MSNPNAGTVVFLKAATHVHERDLHRAEILAAFIDRDFTRFAPALRALGIEQPATPHIPNPVFYKGRQALLTQVLAFAFESESRARTLFPDASFIEVDSFFRDMIDDRTEKEDDDDNILDWTDDEIAIITATWSTINQWEMPRRRDYDDMAIDRGIAHADIVASLFRQKGNWTELMAAHAHTCLEQFELYVRTRDETQADIPLDSWRDMANTLIGLCDHFTIDGIVDDDSPASPYVRSLLTHLERWPDGRCAHERFQNIQTIIDSTADDSALKGRAMGLMDIVTRECEQGPMPSTTQEFDDALRQIEQSIAAGVFPKKDFTIIPP